MTLVYVFAGIAVVFALIYAINPWQVVHREPEEHEEGDEPGAQDASAPR